MIRIALIIGASLLSAAIALAAAPRPTAAGLTAAVEEARQSLARSRAFEQQAAQATDRAARARAETEALAARIQSSEAEITAAETRTALAAALLRAQRARLAERQGPLVRLTAALQTMARRPPALALVQPGSLDDAVRVRSVLAATLPRIRERTAALRGEIDRTRALQSRQDDARRALLASRGDLAARRTALADFEARQRARSQGLANLALQESDRALALGEDARSLERLIGDRAYQRRLETRLAALPGPSLRPGSAAAMPQRPGAYVMPVAGRLLTGSGELSDAGVHARGLTLDVAQGTPILAPARGRVAHAGRFRSYGAVVIIDHGNGWTSVITNVDAVGVQTGQTVDRRAVLGRAGGGRTMVELRLNGRPVPITALLAG